MKKLVCFILALSLAAGSAVCASAEDFIPGDVNSDGRLTVKDATIIQKHCAQAFSFNSYQKKRADADQNGVININDATAVQRAIARAVPKTDYTDEEAVEAGNAAMTDLGVKLLQSARKDGENQLVSPLSVMSALAMTANGAKGDTLKQMETTLGLPLNALNVYFKTYSQNVNNPAASTGRLNLANSVWLNSSFGSVSLNSGFKTAANEFYSAEANALPFDEAALERINSWCAEKTDGMINNVIDKIDGDGCMTLINALAFDGKWNTPYIDSVLKGEFTCSDGTKHEADFMWSTEFYYISDGRASGFVKNFADGNYAFAALLPNNGLTLDKYIKGLNGETLMKTLKNRSYSSIMAALPKFSAEYSAELSDTLIGLGMTDVFDSQRADISGLVDNAPFNPYVSGVIHKNSIEVNETGTRAAAVTSVDVSYGGVPDKTIILNRPFVYMLINTKTNAPFFVGAVDCV